MWRIFETKEVTKALRKLPRRLQKRYAAWVEIVKHGGARNLRNFPGFRDEKLKGRLHECRSSRLNIQYRVIYTEREKIKEIIVLKISPHKHEEIR